MEKFNKIKASLKPLSADERRILQTNIYDVFDSPIATLLIREIISKSQLFTPSSSYKGNYCPYRAATLDGEKNPARYILNLLITEPQPRKIEKESE